jgi:hypothetical protein
MQKSIDTYPGIAEHAKLIREGKIVLTARPVLGRGERPVPYRACR